MKRSYLLGAAAIILVQTPAHAQDSAPAAANASAPSEEAAASESGGYDGEDIVVTARRREESLQKVPIAVTALSGQQLNDLVVFNAQDLNKLSPSLQTSSCNSTRNCFQPVIRGQGTSFGSGQASVAVYFADAPTNDVSLYDLENIQVLKGPQGTLFGETATGGAVILTPKKPGDELDGFVNARLGSYGLRQVEFAIGGPIARDVLAVRVAGQLRRRDGFNTAYISSKSLGGQFPQPTRMDDVDNAEWRVSVVFTPFEGFENYTVYSGAYRKTNGTGALVYYGNPSYMSQAVANTVISANPVTAARFEFLTGYAPPPGLTWAQLINDATQRQLAVGPRALFGSYDASQESKVQSIVNQTRWEVSDGLTVKNVFSLRWPSTRGSPFSVDATDLPLLESPGRVSPGGEHSWTGGWPRRIMTNEFQLLGTLFDERLVWQAGQFINLSKQRSFEGPTSTNYIFANPSFIQSAAVCGTYLAGTTECVIANRTNQKSTGLYAQGTLEIVPGVHATAGIRRSTIDRSSFQTIGEAAFTTFNGQRIGIPRLVGQLPGAAVLKTSIPHERAWTYTLALDWQVSDDVLVYGTHRTGYKGGGVNANLAQSSPDFIFGPERVKDFEIGLKSSWRLGDVRGRLNIAAYSNTYSNIQQLNIQPSSTTTFTTNSADARIRGLEVEASISPSTWFEVSGFFALTDARYKSWLQNASCLSQAWRPQCAGLPSATPILIDHSNGILDVGGSQTRFNPDLFPGTSKYRFSVQPKINLNDWIGEDVSISGNINYRSRFSTENLNYSLSAGNTAVRETVLGTKITEFTVLSGFTTVDARIDWKNIKGSNFSVGASVTNLTNTIAAQGTTQVLTVVGTQGVFLNEPRMFTVEASYKF